MMRKSIGLGLALIVLLLLILLMVSCGGGGGIAQEQYDKVNADLAAAETQISQLESDVQAKDAKLERAQNLMEFFSGFIIPSISGEFADKGQPEVLDLLAEWRQKADDMGDAVLAQKFQTVIDAISGAGGIEPGVMQTMIQDMLTYFIDEMDKAVE